MSKLWINQASGPDIINVNIMRECLSLDKPLKQTTNLQSDSPDRSCSPGMEGCEHHPTVQEGKLSLTNNIPVSLTSQVVIIMERPIYDQILYLTKRNGTISSDQHRFQEQCSCITQPIKCLNDWTRNLDKQTQTDIIYLDFSRAFDRVSRNRLLLKLK